MKDVIVNPQVLRASDVDFNLEAEAVVLDIKEFGQIGISFIGI